MTVSWENCSLNWEDPVSLMYAGCPNTFISISNPNSSIKLEIDTAPINILSIQVCNSQYASLLNESQNRASLACECGCGCAEQINN